MAWSFTSIASNRNVVKSTHPTLPCCDFNGWFGRTNKVKIGERKKRFSTLEWMSTVLYSSNSVIYYSKSNLKVRLWVYLQFLNSKSFLKGGHQRPSNISKPWFFPEGVTPKTHDLVWELSRLWAFIWTRKLRTMVFCLVWSGLALRNNRC